VHDERWTGPAVLRGMSEELSDMDEDTLTELAISGVGETPKGKEAVPAKKESATPRVAKKPKRKSAGWSRPRVRRT